MLEDSEKLKELPQLVEDTVGDSRPEGKAQARVLSVSVASVQTMLS